MTEIEWSLALETLQSDDLSSFERLAETWDLSEMATSRCPVRYANWFSGLGASLLQITSFLRPDFGDVLIRRGLSVDLHSACGLGDIGRIDRILAEDPDAHLIQVDGYYPIQFALRHPSAVRRLLEHGDDVHRPIKKVAWFDWEDQAAALNWSDWRLLHMVALGRGSEPHLEVAGILAEFGADLNFSAIPLGVAPIHLSAIYDRAHIVRWLHEQGASLETGTTDVGPVISQARLFDTSAFEPFIGHDQTPLMLAVGEGQTDAARLLLDLGADVNAIDSLGFTSLHYASGAFWKEDLAMVQLLIERGAKQVAAQDGRRPIEIAAFKGYDSVVRWLSQRD